jgi:hypothetical protein
MLMVFTSYSTANSLMRTIDGRCIPQVAWAEQARKMVGNVASVTAGLQIQVSEIAAAIPAGRVVSSNPILPQQTHI